MKKIFKVCLCSLTVAALISGCSPKAADKTTQEAETKAEESVAAESTAQETMAVQDLTDMDNGTITLGEYKGIEVTKDPVDVTDEEINAEIQKDLDANPVFDEVDRAVESGDQVNIDYVGTKDGKAFDGGTAEGYDLTIGSNQFIDGFEDGLIGHKKGDKVRLDLSFPENYPSKDLAGKPVVFDVTVNKVTLKRDSELNDTFVKENTSFQTIEEYKEDKKQSLIESKKAQADTKLKNDIFSAILKDAAVETNQEAVDANYNNMLAQYTNQAAAYGMDLKSFAGAVAGMSEDNFKDLLKNQAESMVEQRLVMNAIAQKEGIEVTDKDREDTAKERGYESTDKMIETAGKFQVDDYIINTKVMDFLMKNAVIK